MYFLQRQNTDVAKRRIDDVSHFRYAPFNDVAEILIVDVVVLSSNRPLCTFLELVLTIAVTPRLLSIVVNSTWNGADIHFDQAIIGKHSDNLVQLFWLQPHPARQIVVFKTTQQGHIGSTLFKNREGMSEVVVSTCVLTPGDGQAGP